MTVENYNKLSVKSRIGISAIDTSSTSNDNSSVEYFIDELPKKLSKANSFMIIDEVFIIRKKDYQGKATKIYHVFRHSDGRLVCSVPLDDKDEVVKLVTRKIF